MEKGMIDKSCWFHRKEPEPASDGPTFCFNFFHVTAVRRLVAFRCPKCRRIELTAP